MNARPDLDLATLTAATPETRERIRDIMTKARN